MLICGFLTVEGLAFEHQRQDLGRQGLCHLSLGLKAKIWPWP